MVKIEYAAEALLEAKKAVLYYHAQEVNGHRFKITVKETVDRIRQAPLRWPVLDDPVRRCLCFTYPYDILYTIEPEYILVIAIMHLHKDPDYWRSRIRHS